METSLLKIQHVGWMCGIYPWMQTDLRTSFWSLYWNLNEGGILETALETVVMEPRRFYLVPPDLTFSTAASQPFSQFIIHFTFNDASKTAARHILGIPSDESADRLVQEYIQLYESRTQDTPLGELLVNTILGYVLLLYPDKSLFIEQPTDSRIQECIDYICGHLKDSMDNARLARICNMARNSFVRLFTMNMGVSPQTFIRRMRIEQACRLLVKSDYSIKEIAKETGFANQFHFSRIFTRQELISPRDYRLKSSESAETKGGGMEPWKRSIPRRCKTLDLSLGAKGEPLPAFPVFPESRLKEFVAKFEACFIDPELGIVYSGIDPVLRKPAPPSYFKNCPLPPEFKRPDIRVADYYAYDNSTLATAKYLLALVLACRLCGKTSSRLERIRRCVKGFMKIAEIGRGLEYGFMPKAYGRKFSTETDLYDVMAACLAMHEAAPLLGEDEQRQISTLIGKAAEFWVKRDFRYHFFNAFHDDWQWNLDEKVPLLFLAYRHTGEAVFQKELKRLSKKLDHTNEPQLWNIKTGKRDVWDTEWKMGGWLIFNTERVFSGNAIIYDAMFSLSDEAFPPRRAQWRKAILESWLDAEHSLAPDGSGYSLQMFDFDTLKPLRIPVSYISFLPNAGAKTSMGVSTIRGMFQTARHFPEFLHPAIRAATAYFSNYDFEDLFRYEEPERLQKTYLPGSFLLNGEIAADYIWAVLMMEEARRRCNDGAGG